MVTCEAILLTLLLAIPGETTLLEFTASWCGPCQTMVPIVQRLQTDGYPVQQVDVDQQRELASQLKVTGLPCFVLVRDGVEIDRVVGVTTHARLVQMFDKLRTKTSGAGEVDPQTLAAADDDWKTAAGALSSPRTTAGQPAVPASTVRRDFPTVVGREPTSPQAMIDHALRATVRLRVADSSGHGCGTGTIIDAHGDEALVVTCGHIFRESQGKGQIEVEMFVDGQPRSATGTLLSYNLDRDIGLLSFTPGSDVTVARVAPGGYALRKGSPVFSIGCDRGANPSVRTSQITGVDKYLGPPNLVVSGQPVQGRSGGGLFSQDGLLIGICNAADPADNEGIYAALPTIHWELDRVGQRRIYDQRSENALAGLAVPGRAVAGQAQSTSGQLGSRGSAVSGATLPQMPREMPTAAALANGSGLENGAGTNRLAGGQGRGTVNANDFATPGPVGMSVAGVAGELNRAEATRLAMAAAGNPPAPAEAAMGSQPRAPGVGSRSDLTAIAVGPSPRTEVICIIRSPADPRGGERVVVLDNPSVELLSQLEQASRRTGAAAEIASRVQREGMVPVPDSRGPVIRAQSADR